MSNLSMAISPVLTERGELAVRSSASGACVACGSSEFEMRVERGEGDAALAMTPTKRGWMGRAGDGRERAAPPPMVAAASSS